MFEIAKRNEKGLLVYDDEFRRKLMTPKEIAISNEFVKKISSLIEKYEQGEISKDEYNRLVEETNNEKLVAYSRLYDKEFGNRSENVVEKNLLMTPNFATA